MARVTVGGGYSDKAVEQAYPNLLLSGADPDAPQDAPEGSQEAPEAGPASDDTRKAPVELQKGSTGRKAARKPGG